MLRPEALPPVAHDVVPLSGGYDQITSGYQLAPGALRDCINFACRTQGGYYRIDGYERFSGQPAPSAATYVTLSVTLDRGKYLAVGDQGSFGNVLGTVCYLDPMGEFVGLTKTILTYSDPTFVPGPIVINGDTKGAATGIQSNLTQKLLAQIKATAANVYRADIGPVPGSGPIRGVVYFNDTAYAFRDNAAGTAEDIYRSTPSGWELVVLGSTLAFTLLDVTPTEGATVTQGTTTATIDRWVITSGTVEAKTAEGYFVVSNIVNGPFTAASATLPGGTATLGGDAVPITLLPGGKYNFSIGNFSGYYATQRIYGADGVNDGFEFDGSVYVPIPVAAIDKPSYAIVHANHLFYAVSSSLIHSALGNPYNFEVILGAGEIGTGGIITGLLILPGNQGTAALQVTSRSSTWMLYGASAQDWKFVNFNVGVGALDRTLQNLFDAFAADDHGITMLRQSLNYGNFDAARVTHNIQRFIRDMNGQLACSALSRGNSQYRLYYANGFGIYTTTKPDGLVGHGIVLFPDAVECAFDGESSAGQVVSLFGTINGFVMHNDIGTSFDGKKIGAYLNTNINAVKSPRIRKRFRRSVLEVQSEGYVEAQFSYSFEWASAQVLPHMFVNQNLSLSAMPFWDRMLWDNFFWDGRTSDAVSIELEGTGENMQFMVVCEADYIASFTMQSVIFHYSARRANR